MWEPGWSFPRCEPADQVRAAFIPVTFEFTVLCAAHGMAITYLIRNKTLPGMPARNPDPRTTDDKFIALAIDSGASILISGDPDLKAVKTYKGIEMLSPAQFFERYQLS